MVCVAENKSGIGKDQVKRARESTGSAANTDFEGSLENPGMYTSRCVMPECENALRAGMPGRRDAVHTMRPERHVDTRARHALLLDNARPRSGFNSAVSRLNTGRNQGAAQSTSRSAPRRDGKVTTARTHQHARIDAKPQGRE